MTAHPKPSSCLGQAPKLVLLLQQGKLLEQRVPPSQELTSLVLYLVQFTHDEKHQEERQGNTWESGILASLFEFEISCKQGRNFSPCALCTLYAALKKI